MSFHLLVASPGSGKTTHLLARARDLADLGRRVWWVGLPNQRSYLYRRATESGALLGLEFLSAQQVYYRLLTYALRLKPLLARTGQLALVGEALAELRREPPGPGEARLFTRAIAEAKRYGLTPADLPGSDPESERLRRVYRCYERIKGESWDYDDFRIEALKLVGCLTGGIEAAAVMVDGFRELGPLDLRLFRELGRHVEVHVALPEPPPGEIPDETLPERAGGRVECYRAPNPIAEARWVLGALKRDLASGVDPLELAVIAPEAEVKAFVALADEYGVPLMDETPRTLADTLPGRLLLDLLELPDAPTASRLLAIPELTPLTRAALERGVAGFQAIEALAEERGLGGLWRKWLRLLEPGGDEVAWAADLLETGLAAVREELFERDDNYPQFKEHALQRAQEAARVARGDHFRAWWATLLRETALFDKPRGGVALLTAKLASGRRFRRAYLMGAVEGAYTVGDREDYFVPEEGRAPLAGVFAALRQRGQGGLLPRRFRGRDRALFSELRSRADETVITYPEADQGGPLLPAPQLAEEACSLPDLPAASRLELGGGAGFRASIEPLDLGGVGLERLRHYSSCAFRYWAEDALDLDGDRAWWQELISAMQRFSRLDLARLEELRGRFPEAADWLANWSGTLSQLTFGLRLPEGGEGPRAYLHAVERCGDHVTLYHLTAPGRAWSPDRAAERVRGRWTELWAAGYLLERYGGRVGRVDIVVWPIAGDPILALGGITHRRGLISRRRSQVQAASERLKRGDVTPSPGYHCRSCQVFDLCRVGKR